MIGLDQEYAMANKTRRIIGLTLVSIGIALLVLNVLDYVLRWSQMDSSVSAMGLMLAVIGGGLLRGAKEARPEKKG